MLHHLLSRGCAFLLAALLRADWCWYAEKCANERINDRRRGTAMGEFEYPQEVGAHAEVKHIQIARPPSRLGVMGQGITL